MSVDRFNLKKKKKKERERQINVAVSIKRIFVHKKKRGAEGEAGAQPSDG